MLALNTLGDNTASARATGAERSKPRPADEKRPHADFESYMTALVQPVRLEPAAKPQGTPAESPVPLKTGDENPAKARTSGDIIYDSAPQKAGHENAAIEKDASSRTPVERSDAPEVKVLSQRSLRAEKEMLETLGLSNKVTREKKTDSLATSNIARAATNTTAVQQAQKALKPKAENVTSTLNLLQQAPDLVLAKADGLKRLGEKLGLPFLARVSEKIFERNMKPETTPAHTKGTERSEQAAATTPTRTHKTGDGTSDSTTDSQSQGKSGKQSTTKAVSRETSVTDVSATLRPPQGDNTVMANPSNQDIAAARSPNSGIHTTEFKLSDISNTARSADSVRAAIENPLMRADLVRQFNEIMGRAQVLVTDAQNAQFTVKLFPREIGRMDIDLKMIDGEIRGKIVVESEDVKNEMQNFLQNQEQRGSEQQFDLNRIDIEVRNGNQQAQNPERTPDADEILQNLVTRAAATSYTATDSGAPRGNAIYA